MHGLSWPRSSWTARWLADHRLCADPETFRRFCRGAAAEASACRVDRENRRTHEPPGRLSEGRLFFCASRLQDETDDYLPHHNTKLKEIRKLLRQARRCASWPRGEDLLRRRGGRPGWPAIERLGGRASTVEPDVPSAKVSGLASGTGALAVYEERWLERARPAPLCVALFVPASRTRATVGTILRSAHAYRRLQRRRSAPEDPPIPTAPRRSAASNGARSSPWPLARVHDVSPLDWWKTVSPWTPAAEHPLCTGFRGRRTLLIGADSARGFPGPRHGSMRPRAHRIPESACWGTPSTAAMAATVALLRMDQMMTADEPPWQIYRLGPPTDRARAATSPAVPHDLRARAGPAISSTWVRKGRQSPQLLRELSPQLPGPKSRADRSARRPIVVPPAEPRGIAITARARASLDGRRAREAPCLTDKGSTSPTARRPAPRSVGRHHSSSNGHLAARSRTSSSGLGFRRPLRPSRGRSTSYYNFDALNHAEDARRLAGWLGGTDTFYVRRTGRSSCGTATPRRC